MHRCNRHDDIMQKLFKLMFSEQLEPSVPLNVLPLAFIFNFINGCTTLISGSRCTLVSRYHCIKCGALQVNLQDTSSELKYILRQVLALNVVNHLVLEISSPLSTLLPVLT